MTRPNREKSTVDERQGVADLSRERVRLRVSGADRVEFLGVHHETAVTAGQDNRSVWLSSCSADSVTEFIADRTEFPAWQLQSSPPAVWRKRRSAWRRSDGPDYGNRGGRDQTGNRGT